MGGKQKMKTLKMIPYFTISVLKHYRDIDATLYGNDDPDRKKWIKLCIDKK